MPGRPSRAKPDTMGDEVTKRHTSGWAEPILAAAWLIVGALQYLGAHQRMLLLSGQRPWLEALAFLDLTGVYVLLVVGTIVCLVLRAMRSRGVSSPR